MDGRSVGGVAAMNPSGKMKHVEAHEYARKSEREMTVFEFISIFPMPYRSAHCILHKYCKHKSLYAKSKCKRKAIKRLPKLAPPANDHAITLDRSINYKDFARRAATRERIRQNKAKAVMT